MRVTNTVSTSRATYALSSAPGFQRDWEQVRVERVELYRAVPPSSLGRVQVCLFLGRLLPVDVEAELVIEIDGGAAPPATVRERLWSSHSYQNGSYLFEAHVADERLAAARHLHVHVRPRDRARDVARAGDPAGRDVAPARRHAGA